MHRRIISFIITLTLVLSLGLNFYGVQNTVNAEEPQRSPEKKYHLDMGVYVVAKSGRSWAKGVAYGDTKPYTANLTFNEGINPLRVMSIDQAIGEGINVWDESVCTNNMNKGENPTWLEAYERIYKDSVSTNITGRAITANDENTMAYSAQAKLYSSPAPYDLVVQYNRIKNIISTVSAITWEKDQTTANKIAQLEAEKQELMDWFYIHRGQSEEATQKSNRLAQINSELSVLRNKSQYISKEEVITSYILDTQRFIDETFKFWGPEGKGQGSGYQNLHDLNLSMWQMLVNMSELKDIPEGTEYYLVFLPTVIEYEEVLPPPPPILIPATTGGCSSEIGWPERHEHEVQGPDGKPRTCRHACYYVATLSSSATLTADKPNGAPLAFKSGYGFKVTMNNTVSVKMTSSVGNRCEESKYFTNREMPAPPTAAEVRTDWKVVNNEKRVTQGTVIALAKASSSSNTANFATAPNPVSNYNNPLIYTDVELPGTRQKPEPHTITVYASGGGVNGVAFCNSVPLTFVINGNMYEDDSTSDRTR